MIPLVERVCIGGSEQEHLRFGGCRRLLCCVRYAGWRRDSPVLGFQGLKLCSLFRFSFNLGLKASKVVKNIPMYGLFQKPW